MKARSWRLAGVKPASYRSVSGGSTVLATQSRVVSSPLAVGVSVRVFAHAAAAVVMVTLLVGCAKPDPVLTAGTVRAWQANQAVIALGELQRSAITYHSAAMLSEANTRVVVEAITPALERIKAKPPSWKPVGLGALNQIDKGLDGKGHERMDVHVAKARSTLNGL